MVRRGSARDRLALTDLAAAYSATGGSWQRGPDRIYDRLAEALVARSAVPLDGATVLDVGAGTGAATRAARRAGAARVVAVDAASGMLTHDPDAAARWRSAAVGDVVALPFVTAAFDASVAAFVLNHLTDPAAGLAEMRRVTRPGGMVLAATLAADDAHPVKEAVEAAAAVRGWVPDRWYAEMRHRAVPLLSTVAGCATAMRAAGLDPHVRAVRVAFPALDAHDLVMWRLGLVQHARFFAALAPEAGRELVADAVARIGDPPAVLVRSVLVLSAVNR